MSLSNTSVGNTYSCNGVTTSFAIPFQYQLASEVKVYLILIADGVETLLVDPTHYSISGSNVVTVAAYANTYRLRVERATAKTQLLDLINNSAFLAEDLEETLDKMVQVLQELSNLSDQSFKLSRIDYTKNTQFPLLVEDAILVVNPTGDGFDMGPTLTAFDADVAATAAAAAAAAGSEANAAASAAAALSSQNAASLSANNASLSEAAALVSEAAALAAQVAAEAAQAAAEAAVANIDTVPYVEGTRVLPVAVTTSILPGDPTKWFSTLFIIGQSTAQTITDDPRILPAGNIGAKLRLVGCSDTQTVTIPDGQGVELNGDIVLANGTVIELEWDGSVWLECYRNGL